MLTHTLIFTVDAERPSPRDIEKAACFIKSGGSVAFPTETVYGLGANALDARAVRKLFDAKNRPLDNPPIIHVSDRSEVDGLVKQIPEEAEKLMEIFWPGPLTLIFQHSSAVPDITVAGLETIALRMPRQNVALALIVESDCPIAAPSANLAGCPSPTSASHVLHDLDGRIDAVLDAGPVQIGVESTVLDLTTDPPRVLRPGGLPYEQLIEVLGRVELDPIVTADYSLPLQTVHSPGMKHKHYAPKADIVLVEGDVSKIIDRVNGISSCLRSEGKRVGILSTDETREYYRGNFVVKSLGSRADVAGIARNLFALLREFDAEGVDIIVAEGISQNGLGLAVMNRLRKASAYRICKA